MASSLLSSSFCYHLSVPIIIFFPSGWVPSLRFVPISPNQEEEILPKIVLVAACVPHLQDTELVLPPSSNGASSRKDLEYP